MLIEPFSLSLLFFLQWPRPVQFLAGEQVLIFKQDQQQRPRLLQHMVRGRSRIILVPSHREVSVSRFRSQWGDEEEEEEAPSTRHLEYVNIVQYNIKSKAVQF